MKPAFELFGLLPSILISIAVGLVVAILLDRLLSRFQMVLRSHYGDSYAQTPNGLTMSLFQLIAVVIGTTVFLQLV